MRHVAGVTARLTGTAEVLVDVEGQIAGVRGSGADRDLHPHLLEVLPAHPEHPVIIVVVLVSHSSLHIPSTKQANKHANKQTPCYI